MQPSLGGACQEAALQKSYRHHFGFRGKSDYTFIICQHADKHTAMSHTASGVLERNFSVVVSTAGNVPFWSDEYACFLIS